MKKSIFPAWYLSANSQEEVAYATTPIHIFSMSLYIRQYPSGIIADGSTAMRRHSAIVLSLFLLSGCATLDKEECQVADWRVIGYEDGANGRELSYLGNHRKACAKYGITPDMARYESGRLEGLREYCTPRNGYDLGKSGRKYNSACMPPMETEFREAWSHGIEIYKARTQLQNSERRLKNQQKLADDLRQQIDERESELVSDGISSEQRKALLAEIKELSRKLDDVASEVLELQERVVDDRGFFEQVEARYQY
jgi:hypothetical protein